MAGSKGRTAKSRCAPASGSRGPTTDTPRPPPDQTQDSRHRSRLQFQDPVHTGSLKDFVDHVPEDRIHPKGNKDFPFQVAGGHGRLRGQGMIPRQDANRLKPREGPGLDRGVVDRQGAQADIALPRNDPLEDPLRRLDLQGHEHVGIGAGEPADHFRHQGVRETGDRHQADVTRSVLPDGFRGSEDLIETDERAIYLLVKSLPFRGRDQLPIGALEKLEPDFGLQLGDHSADGRLGHGKDAGGPGRGPGDHHGTEGLDLAERCHSEHPLFVRG